MTIKDARKAKGITQNQMSKFLKIPRRTIEDWDAGKSQCAPWAERLIIKELLKMKKIKLVEEAYLRNGEYRQGIFALNEWYQAAAEDEDGNQYTVIWKIKEDYNAEIMDEDAACDWVEPWNVSNEDGENVTDEVIIIN